MWIKNNNEHIHKMNKTKHKLKFKISVRVGVYNLSGNWKFKLEWKLNFIFNAYLYESIQINNKFRHR